MFLLVFIIFKLFFGTQREGSTSGGFRITFLTLLKDCWTMQTNRGGSYCLSALKKQHSLLCFIRMSIWLGIQLQGSLNQDRCSHISSFHCMWHRRGVCAQCSRLSWCLQSKNGICHLRLLGVCRIPEFRIPKSVTGIPGSTHPFSQP